MARAKVLHLITRLDLGGAQHNTLYTASRLDGEGFEVVLACGRGGALEMDLAGAPPDLRVAFVDDLVRDISPGRDLLAFFQIWSLFLAERPDVVHTHSSKAGILGRLAARLAGVPAVVHTYHGFGFHDYQAPWLRRAYIAAERFCARLADALVFVSRANLEAARGHALGRPERFRLIRSGIKLSDYPARVPDRAAKKASMGLRMHKPLVCSVGNLKPQKNPGDFVAMAQLVNASLPETDFVFVGDGPLRRRLEYQVIASGLHNRLSLAGWRRDVPEVLAVSDVYVMTSLWEGLPRALVEAMKSGLPPVCYATDGIADIIRDGENGFLVPPGNVSALAGRVLELLKNEALRRRLGEAAARSIGEEFDIDLMVKRQEELYRELLSRA